MSGADPKAGGDPSMEDILASIRKILNEDEQQEAAAPVEPPADEPLVLTEDMLVQEPVAPPPLPVVAAPPPAPARIVADSGEGLLAPAVAAAAAASLGALSQAVARERASAVSRGGPSIEDVVREELRPLLKDWLDTHLAAMVERMVQAEIERVMRR